MNGEQKVPYSYGLGPGRTLTANVGGVLRFNGQTARGFNVQALDAPLYVVVNARLIGGEAIDPGGLVILDKDSDGVDLAVSNSGNVFTLDAAHAGKVDLSARGSGIGLGVTAEIYDPSNGGIWREYVVTSAKSALSFEVEDVDGATYTAVGGSKVRFRNNSYTKRNTRFVPITYTQANTYGVLVPAGESMVFGAAVGDDRSPSVHLLSVVSDPAVSATIAGGFVVTS